MSYKTKEDFMVDYKPNFFKSHRKTIFLIILFTLVFGFRTYYDYIKLQPITIPVLKHDFDGNQIISDSDIKQKIMYKINLSEDTVISKDYLVGKYVNSKIIADYPISKKQIVSRENKYGYLADIPKDRRVIPLPADVNSSGININDRIEITSSQGKNQGQEEYFESVYVFAEVKDKIDAKGISYDTNINQTEAQRGNVPKVLMVEVSTAEAKVIEDAIARSEQINVRLVPPSYYEGGANK